jgi:hypothetical protein
MPYPASTGTVSSASRRSERSSSGWSNRSSDSQQLKNDRGSDPYVDAINCSHGHHNSEEGEDGYESSKASQVRIRPASAS